MLVLETSEKVKGNVGLVLLPDSITGLLLYGTHLANLHTPKQEHAAKQETQGTVQYWCRKRHFIVPAVSSVLVRNGPLSL